MAVGIDEVAVAIPKYYIDVKELAEYRKLEPERILDGLGVESCSIPYGQDLVSLGVEALSNLDLRGVRRFYIATESSTDMSKPYGTKILTMLGLKHAETVELKFACQSGALALQDACSNTMVRKKPSVVLCLDRSVYGVGGTEEFTQGCASIALKVEEEPSIVELNLNETGSYIEDVDDFIIPAGSSYPIVHGKLSIISYLHALKEAYDDWVIRHPEIKKSPLDYFDHFCFHTPFPKMAHHAFAMLYRRERLGKHLTIKKFIENPSLYEEDRLDRKKIIELPEFQHLFKLKVEPSLHFSKFIGNCYSASIFLALISQLESGVKREARLAFGAYGSGAGSLAFDGIIKTEKLNTGIVEQLRVRKKLSIEQYEAWRESILK